MLSQQAPTHVHSKARQLTLLSQHAPTFFLYQQKREKEIAPMYICIHYKTHLSSALIAVSLSQLAWSSAQCCPGEYIQLFIYMYIYIRCKKKKLSGHSGEYLYPQMHRKNGAGRSGGTR